MAITLQKRLPVGELFPDRAAYNLVRSFEGLALTAYPDPASPLARTGKGSGEPWTAGYGSTGPHVTPGLRITLKTADDWLDADMAKAAAIVRASINVELTQSEFSALTALAFNLGKIPPSIRAALNGGVTDKGVPLEPRSYGSALAQFPRNCRAGGVPMRGLLRRRLAEACLYSNLPWENACSINLIRLKLTPDGNIDWSESTTLEDTLAFARQDIPEAIPPLPPMGKPPFDPQWPRKPAPEPTITIIEDIEKPAEGVPSPSSGERTSDPTAPPEPAVLSTPSETTAEQPVRADSAEGAAGKSPSIETSAAPTLPPVVVGTKPIHPDTKMPEHVPYGLDPRAGLKPMESTERFIGAAFMFFGTFIRIGMANGMKLSGIGGMIVVAILDFLKSPTNLAVAVSVVAIAITGCLWCVGFCMDKFGLKKKKRGERTSTQGMY